jgi:hypothetical protein
MRFDTYWRQLNFTWHDLWLWLGNEVVNHPFMCAGILVAIVLFWRFISPKN